MKKFILIVILLISSKDFAQSRYNYKQGSKFIEKAQTEIQKGNLSEAQMNLEKAGKSNYGFCGNAWASAESKINLLKAEIFNRKNEFDKSLSVLDSMAGCGFGADCEARDSLKIVTLSLKFGSEKVKKSFKNVMAVKVKPPNIESSYSIYIADLNYTFVFQSWVGSGYSENENSEENDGHKFIKLIEKHKYYKLLE
ncbi:hypothetical protein [Flavobacterium panacagri]|uniref:hypothetical protein n=1 Tax=Flavobacterium panacagri TaxID=3034146 RepID=UPI0025A62313|nr:hypothetical protein [Flavobacterium panacagri]